MKAVTLKKNISSTSCQYSSNKIGCPDVTSKVLSIEVHHKKKCERNAILSRMEKARLTLTENKSFIGELMPEAKERMSAETSASNVAASVWQLPGARLREGVSLEGHARLLSTLNWVSQIFDLERSGVSWGEIDRATSCWILHLLHSG